MAEMIPKDLFKKVRRIEITTRRLVTDVFAGQYHSAFKGHGIEFEEVREYTPGDDVRSIDWNVTARSGRVYIKKYAEERELTVMLLVDGSGSTEYGTVHHFKTKLAAEISSLIAFAAIRNNDKIGLIIFTDRIEQYIPPQKGVKNVLRLIREVLYTKPQGHSTNLCLALDYLNKIRRRPSVAFMISDFFLPAQNKQIADDRLKNILASTNRRHDLIAVTLNDPSEDNIPDCGLVTLVDAETHAQILVDTSHPRVRREYAKSAQERLKSRKKMFMSAGIDFIDISTDGSYSQAMVKFFLSRQRRLH